MNTNIHKNHPKKSWGLMLAIIWIINCLLMSAIAIHEIWLPKMNAAGKTYTNVRADAFDGTVMPISFIPNWNKTALQDKSLDFRNIATSDLVAMPQYNSSRLSNANNVLERFTYTVLYMGSYTLNYKENDGSHLGVDIRAPIGTPVLSIANGVVVRAVEADASGNKFVVIRHENVPYNGKTVDLYSGYLHLSEISVKEGAKIRKGEMLGRVGMTGITTTPHLHFQIDTADAPFHPYWPYTSTDASRAGLTFLQGVTAGLGADKARQFTVNPMEFVQYYLSGNTTVQYVESTPKTEIPLKAATEVVNTVKTEFQSAPEIKTLDELVNFTDASSSESNIVVASAMYNLSTCENIFAISPDSEFAKTLEKISKNNCIFDGISLSADKKMTRSEVLSVLMKYYGENPASGISPFDDISLGDTSVQGYALRAFQKGIFTGENMRPYDTLTRAEFLEILARFGKLKTAPAGYNAYSDLSQSSTLYKNIQNFAYTIGVKNAKLYPNREITQYEVTKFLSYLP